MRATYEYGGVGDWMSISSAQVAFWWLWPVEPEGQTIRCYAGARRVSLLESCDLRALDGSCRPVFLLTDTPFKNKVKLYL